MTRDGVAVWVVRESAGEHEALLLCRAVEPFFGLWFAVEGKLDPGEDPVAAALRELREETSLTPARLYHQRREPWLVPSAGYEARISVFVAFVSGATPVLNAEHSAYRWCRPSEARRLLPDGPHQECFREIERDFFRASPPPALEIGLP